MDKKELRKYIRSKKAELSEPQKIDAARNAFALLEQVSEFQDAEHILLYYSLPDELSTHSFIELWHGKKHIYLPRVNGSTLDILPYNPEAMGEGAYNIEEPTGSDIVPIDRIELIIVPAMGYDRKGNRLGRGKGYYDQLLCQSHAPKIGVIYDFQLLEEIPTEPHDIPVDIVITPTQMI
ncbi:MAG: 5-formyltetrahydrofolate cyclo-ligase [Bacteroidales bacterium]|nr:5-formyltetrahydrofolate cyclo-ligase [Bacteroidales bacterium]